jgi:hypothetical protein
VVIDDNSMAKAIDDMLFTPRWRDFIMVLRKEFGVMEASSQPYDCDPAKGKRECA